ncbi:hypothetical protein DL96DRAFT_1628423 [Flagelloscypha sp. PMI_526]|nr:hypothetical protein DL96DRAFT_1628423 [Flagelloscypha sp. PMI_526]
MRLYSLTAALLGASVVAPAAGAPVIRRHGSPILSERQLDIVTGAIDLFNGLFDAFGPPSQDPGPDSPPQAAPQPPASEPDPDVQDFFRNGNAVRISKRLLSQKLNARQLGLITGGLDIFNSLFDAFGPQDPGPSSPQVAPPPPAAPASPKVPPKNPIHVNVKDLQGPGPTDADDLEGKIGSISARSNILDHSFRDHRPRDVNKRQIGDIISGGVDLFKNLFDSLVPPQPTFTVLPGESIPQTPPNTDVGTGPLHITLPRPPQVDAVVE